MIAQHLYEHPEGVSPRMVPTGQTSTDHGLEWFIKRVQEYPRDDFVELTGEIGDVVIMHPLMLHSAGRNTLRVPRVITNPAIETFPIRSKRCG
jgi:ectoine hydroxylase-related dioxygenase (phytanoyl-CoA dioxygenase family)